MATSLNRALHVRVADRLRTSLVRHVASGLPDICRLSDVDQREFLDAGGGRLAVIALRLDPTTLREVVRLVSEAIRRTDLFGALADDTLLILAPGLTPNDGDVLLARLRSLTDHLHVRLGLAYRSSASVLMWTSRALAAEAEALVA
ncbi:MAG: hypothetical protein NVSMB2_03590 [Chloroflexota bacterium]